MVSKTVKMSIPFGRLDSSFIIFFCSSDNSLLDEDFPLLASAALCSSPMTVVSALRRDSFMVSLVALSTSFSSYTFSFFSIG